MQTLTVLGSTGSIGTQTLDVVARHPQRYRIYALTAQERVQELAQQCQQFVPRFVVIAPEHAPALRWALQARGLTQIEVLSGPQALCEVACAPEVDTVMAAIVGAAGLAPCAAAARSGKKLLLANKEEIGRAHV